MFIEKNPERVKDLEKLKQEFPDKANKISILEGDANARLTEWCALQDWRKTRAVVFLDPYGMNVEWKLLETLAATRGIDLWLLFPLGMGVMRMLTKRGLPSKSWQEKLTRIFGTDIWRDEFYSKTCEDDLFFGVTEKTERIVAPNDVGNFMIKRMETAFHSVLKETGELKNSKNNTIFILIFASGNPKGSSPAMKIAKDLIKNLKNE